jgi:hypothetical protein
MCNSRICFCSGMCRKCVTFVEMRCSGRRSCSGVLMEINAKGICESPARNYLEASYSCIKGNSRPI